MEIRKPRLKEKQNVLGLVVNNTSWKAGATESIESYLDRVWDNLTIVKHDGNIIAAIDGDKIYAKDNKVKQALNKSISEERRKKVVNLYANKEKLNIQYKEMDGVKYLVAPVVMVREQVLNGEYLPAEEIAKSAPGWNGKPVVVYHPKDNAGRDTLANDPSIIPKYKIGELYNVFYEPETTKLKGEVWIDIAKANKKSRDTREALEMIKNSEELEVSTGYMVNDRVPVPGEFNGEAYVATQKQILPDHLALLPQEIGACSWEDGAGVRNNSRKSLTKMISNLFKNNDEFIEASNLHDAILEALDSADSETYYIVDVELNEDTGLNFVTYGVENTSEETELDEVYKSSFTIDTTSGKVVIGDTFNEIDPMTLYITDNKEEKNLNKEKLVRDVIANSNGKFGRKDRATLTNLSEAVLIDMLHAAKKKAYKKNAIKNNVFKGKTFKTNEGEEMLVEELIGMDPTEVEAVVMDLDDAELQSIVEVIEEAKDTLDTVEAIVESELMGGEEDFETEATNVDVTDVFDPNEEEEEETVSALETASRKVRKNKKIKSNEEMLASLPDGEFKDFVTDAIKEEKRNRAIMINELDESGICDYDKKALTSMKTQDIKKLHSMMSKAIAATNTNYSIRGNQSNAKYNAKAEEKGFTPLSRSFKK